MNLFKNNSFKDFNLIISALNITFCMILIPFALKLSKNNLSIAKSRFGIFLTAIAILSILVNAIRIILKI